MLYYSPGACSLASHIALEEAGADVDYVRVDLAKGESRTPEYLALNPKVTTTAGSFSPMATTRLPLIRGPVTPRIAGSHRFRGYRWCAANFHRRGACGRVST